jgi:hypothetical protein
MGYNKFRWFTNTTARPLSGKAPLLLKIRNGDFERTPYFGESYEARKSAVQAYEDTLKNSLISDPNQLEREAMDSARMKRVKALKLMELGDADEFKRLKALKEGLEAEFGLDKIEGNTIWEEAHQKQRGKGTTEDLYWWYKKKMKFHMTPSEMDIKLRRSNTKGLEYLFV